MEFLLWPWLFIQCAPYCTPWWIDIFTCRWSISLGHTFLGWVFYMSWHLLQILRHGEGELPPFPMWWDIMEFSCWFFQALLNWHKLMYYSFMWNFPSSSTRMASFTHDHAWKDTYGVCYLYFGDYLHMWQLTHIQVL
jgi:hypothetical protein